MQTQQNTGLVWFKNDLRVHDNIVLNSAIENNNAVIAVFCFNPDLFNTDTFGFKKTEKFRAQFLIESVSNLKENLKSLNIELLVFHNKPEQAISKLVSEYNIKNIYLQKEWTSEEKHSIKKVKDLIPNKVIWHELFNQFLFHPEDINLNLENIPQVFTNFRKKVEKESRVRPSTSYIHAKENLQKNNETKISKLTDLGFENFEKNRNSAFPFKGGETAALKRLNHYFFETKKLGFYKKTRNGLIGTDFSSKFSPWLANGSLSPRTIYWEVKKFETEHFKNDSTYWLIFELIWRDYFKYVSLKHNSSIFKIGGILNKNYHWNTNKTNINHWINGTTASPFVNANMIELKKTGWMSNRGRQNVASYFSKELMLDWRIGAAYFESMLLDYDVHSNYGNWMYVSGVGNDPRDRKFNVQLQAERYDANGKFQNLWLQETLF
ncbi:DASH family cryptochrome [Algibacter amylolyticus]|uniref:Cryptochrome DASH n=1 Tax=Algibacter amylolyticus TaxID=1608400 RepID=A0A5M7B4W5_9FLAO|nr:DASH family cryptochrome [Algibacter amylolyticus]KAA5823427.1 DASH family cryptochrome [Algibacter amylolyticus]MBB5267577.1 deoxyribodipyrimidine photo-lyase [Algibacter amylolyticus]TSJ73915.1 DASH family cryptochrome [Algibacter amylolyticus]